MKRTIIRLVSIFSLILNIGLVAETSAPAHASGCTVTVTNTNDSGAGSLRSAMQSGGYICFNITGSGVHVIIPGSSLPAIGVASTIDGTSQPGYAGSPLIEIQGQSAGSNTTGIVVNAGNTTIKGLDVVNFGGDGIILNNNGSNTVTANYVGIDPSGTTAMANLASGIGMQSSNNVIGGTTAAARNLVSGNSGTGIAVTGASISGNTIEGNYVGTNAAGTGSVPNGADGVLITQSPNNTVGGTTGVSVGGNCTGACNLLSGNNANGAGIWQSTATGNVIEGNYVGTDYTGLNPDGNANIGIEAQDAPNNTIGGTTPAARNIMSGNGGAGGDFDGTNATGNVMEGNYIGTDRSGLGQIANHKMGINLGSPDGGSDNASNNTIGGTAGTSPGGACTGACNVIVASYWAGIYISGNTGGNNEIAGNNIGVGADGMTPIGNVQDGIGIVDSSNNHVGGPSSGARNIISDNGHNGIAIVGNDVEGTRIQGNFIGERTDQGPMGNGESGVDMEGGINNAVLGNAIFNNGTLGIRLFNAANELEPAPHLNYSIPTGSLETVSGTLQSNPTTAYQLDVFVSPYCSSHGEGWSYVGAAQFSTNSSGYDNFTLNVPIIAPGMAVTAVANKMIGSTPWEASPFSNCVNTPRQHPDGTLIRPVGSNNIYYVDGGGVEPIGSASVLQSFNYTSADIKTATNADTNLSAGPNSVYFRDGTLLRGQSSPNIYAIFQTATNAWCKRLITNNAAFDALGYTAADVITVPDSNISNIPSGTDMSDASLHPDGTVVKDPNSATLYLILNGQKEQIPTVGDFLTNKYTASEIKTATTGDMALTTGPQLGLRQGSLIQGSGPQIYVVAYNGATVEKRMIASPSAFLELGYTSADVVSVPDAELPATDGTGI